MCREGRSLAYVCMRVCMSVCMSVCSSLFVCLSVCMYVLCVVCAHWQFCSRILPIFAGVMQAGNAVVTHNCKDGVVAMLRVRGHRQQGSPALECGLLSGCPPFFGPSDFGDFCFRRFGIPVCMQACWCFDCAEHSRVVRSHDWGVALTLAWPNSVSLPFVGTMLQINSHGEYRMWTFNVMKPIAQ